ncbi:hypothetical protein NM688_g1947 [Phlebia brevispora]|uniref:Uncharacterized protein n=1 Tax=Phlebia brevispora TaxID=194682 RepID=A0ACC1TAE2_9APHY|nr:hypothetical protein NM688_g1947 [Phlebia brevispora]
MEVHVLDALRHKNILVTLGLKVYGAHLQFAVHPPHAPALRHIKWTETQRRMSLASDLLLRTADREPPSRTTPHPGLELTSIAIIQSSPDQTIATAQAAEYENIRNQLSTAHQIESDLSFDETEPEYATRMGCTFPGAYFTLYVLVLGIQSCALGCRTRRLTYMPAARHCSRTEPSGKCVHHPLGAKLPPDRDMQRRAQVAHRMQRASQALALVTCSLLHPPCLILSRVTRDPGLQSAEWRDREHLPCFLDDHGDRCSLDDFAMSIRMTSWLRASCITRIVPSYRRSVQDPYIYPRSAHPSPVIQKLPVVYRATARASRILQMWKLSYTKRIVQTLRIGPYANFRFLPTMDLFSRTRSRTEHYVRTLRLETRLANLTCQDEGTHLVFLRLVIVECATGESTHARHGDAYRMHQRATVQVLCAIFALRLAWRDRRQGIYATERSNSPLHRTSTIQCSAPSQLNTCCPLDTRSVGMLKLQNGLILQYIRGLIMMLRRIVQYIYMFTVLVLGLSLGLSRVIMERFILALFSVADADEARVEDSHTLEGEGVNAGLTEAHDIQDLSAGGRNERQDEDALQDRAEPREPHILQERTGNTDLEGRYNLRSISEAVPARPGLPLDETVNVALGVPDDTQAQAVDSRLTIVPSPPAEVESVSFSPDADRSTPVDASHSTSRAETGDPDVGASEPRSLPSVESVDTGVSSGGPRSLADDSKFLGGSSSRDKVETHALKKPSIPLEHLDCRCAYSDPRAHKPVDLDVVSRVTKSLSDRYHEWKKWYDLRAPDLSPRKIVIYSDEELQGNAQLDVPIQVKHTTTEPVISSSLASESCERLGVEGLLRNFNKLLDTSYSVEIPGLRRVLEQCIERYYDFGTVFGCLRTFWVNYGFDGRQVDTSRHILRSDFTGLIELLDDKKQKDEEDRLKALDHQTNIIVNPAINPRRVWDLISNRVVPTFTVHEARLEYDGGGIWAVSHSWMAAERRCNVDTPINGHEWLVPLPDDTTLDRIRVELLNLGVQYVWLDVLCLRQEDSQKPENKPAEDKRKKEWELDVPTIGSIYHRNMNIVTYLNGLGRPFEIGDITSNRHWLNRAWTLQEGSTDTLIGGLTAHSESSFLAHTMHDSDALYEPPLHAKQFYGELCMALHAGPERWTGLFAALEAMLNREATYTIDKVAGLTYILRRSRSRNLPVYLRDKDNSAEHEQAWSVLIAGMDSRNRAELAFLYPVPGDGRIAWRPSWSQLTPADKTLKIPLAPMESLMQLSNPLSADAVEEDGSFKLTALLVRNCTIQSLAVHEVEKYCRRGKLTIHGGSSIEGEHTFNVEAHHQQLISEGQNYILVGYLDMDSTWNQNQFWIVGIETKQGSIRKVTVLRMESEDDCKRLAKLKLATLTEVTLI